MEQISREDKKEPNTCKAIRNGKRERIEKENERGIKIHSKFFTIIKGLLIKTIRIETQSWISRK